MTARYFYKGIPLNDLISDGNNGNPTLSQLTNIGDFQNVPGIFTDNKPFSQVETTGYTNSNGIDIGKSYTAFYQTTNVVGPSQINLQTQTIQKIKYDTIAAVIIGGSGGGGGGGGAGFENKAPANTSSGYSGNGGGGGGLSIYPKSLITASNQLDIFVGSGGGGGAGGNSSGGDDGQRGQDGQAGQFSRFILQNGVSAQQTTIANGGQFGYGGNPGDGDGNSGPINNSQGAGGTGTVSGQKGNTAQTTDRNIPGQGGAVGSGSNFPVFNSAGGRGGTCSNQKNTPAGSAQSGSNGCVRIYFFKS